MTCRALALLFVVACGAKKPNTANILEADDATLSDCSFLQKVEGAGDNNTAAQRAAKEQAASVGATHIKWIVPCCTTVEAQAFRCDVPGE